MKKCPNCGKEMDENAIFCSQCGREFVKEKKKLSLFERKQAKERERQEIYSRRVSLKHLCLISVKKCQGINRFCITSFKHKSSKYKICSE